MDGRIDGWMDGGRVSDWKEGWIDSGRMGRWKKCMKDERMDDAKDEWMVE